MTEEKEHRFVASPTMWEFMQSDKFVRLIAGSVGSGKSVLCCHELVRLAIDQKPNHKGERKTRALIVRNTADQLRSTTHKTFMDWFGHLGVWKATERTFYVDQPLGDGTKLKAEFMFIALDTPDDVRKALSLEATFCWMNEARELHPTVVEGLLMRLRRYPSTKDGGFTRSCALMDTNFPDMDSWMFQQMEEPPSNWSIHIQPPAILSLEEYVEQYGEDPQTEPVEDAARRQWYVNPGADNIDNVDSEYYPGNIPGKSQDFIDVYLRCRYGRSLSGLPVYDKTFNADFHVADGPLIPIKSTEYPIIIGQDFGRTPSCTLVQRNVHGQLVVLAEATSENMGIETFIEQKLLPLVSQEKFAGCSFIVAPDPAGFLKQQIGEVSMVDVLRNAGFTVVKPVTNDPEKRVQAVERALSSSVGGRPGLLIDPGCEKLIKGFKFGYRYKLNRAGQQEVKPDKNEFSHVHDSLQYATLVAEGNQDRGSAVMSRKRRDVRPARYAWA